MHRSIVVWVSSINHQKTVQYNDLFSEGEVIRQFFFTALIIFSKSKKAHNYLIIS